MPWLQGLANNSVNWGPINLACPGYNVFKPQLFWLQSLRTMANYLKRVLASALHQFCIVRDGEVWVPVQNLAAFHAEVSGLGSRKLSRKQLDAVAHPVVDGAFPAQCLLQLLRLKGAIVDDAVWSMALDSTRQTLTAQNVLSSSSSHCLAEAMLVQNHIPTDLKNRPLGMHF